MGKRSLKTYDSARDKRASFYIPCEVGMVDKPDMKFCDPQCTKRKLNGDCKKWKSPMTLLDMNNENDLKYIRNSKMILIGEDLVF